MSNIFLGKIILYESKRKDFIRPVLKHGPRSPAYTRVPGWKTLARSESKATLRIVFVTSIDSSNIGTLTFFVRLMWELYFSDFFSLSPQNQNFDLKKKKKEKKKKERKSAP